LAFLPKSRSPKLSCLLIKSTLVFLKRFVAIADSTSQSSMIKSQPFSGWRSEPRRRTPGHAHQDKLDEKPTPGSFNTPQMIWRHKWLLNVGCIVGRPHTLAKILNRGWAFIHALGIYPNYLVTLEVAGRQSGKVISLPLAMIAINGERYLVSMLGEAANWVQNIKAAGDKATLRHGIPEQVLLEEIAASRRAPILPVYLQSAPGARPHIPVSQDAPVSEFEKIVAQYPVFRVVSVK
jgi:hypothetical protein